MSMKRIPVILVALLLVCLPAASARADMAPPEDPVTAGISPDFEYMYTEVRMVSENVVMTMGMEDHIIQNSHDMYPNWDIYTSQMLYVTAEFKMLNLGTIDETMKVMFPTSSLNCYSYDVYYQGVSTSFSALVDGQIVTHEIITTDNPRLRGCDPVNWAVFQVTFPVDTIVSIFISYKMEGYALMDEYPEWGPDQVGYLYILETGAAWRGTIGIADISFVAPFDLTAENSWGTPNFTRDGNTLLWHFEDFEPTELDNIEINIVGPELWQGILNSRDQVKTYPENAQEWFTLAERYAYLAVGEHGSRITSLGFANLAEEAYQEAIALDPNVAEYHHEFAEFLVVRCVVQAHEMGVDSTTDLSYCAASAYEADYAWTLDPGNEEFCLYSWIGYISDYDSPCPTSTSAYTPTRTPSGTPTVTPTRTNRPPSTPFPTWRPSGTLLPTAVPPQQDDTSGFPIFLFIFGGLVVITAVILFVRKRQSARRG